MGFGVVVGWGVAVGVAVEEGGGELDPCPMLLRMLSHLLVGKLLNIYLVRVSFAHGLTRQHRLYVVWRLI